MSEITYGQMKNGEKSKSLEWKRLKINAKYHVKNVLIFITNRHRKYELPYDAVLLRISSFFLLDLANIKSSQTEFYI